MLRKAAAGIMALLLAIGLSVPSLAASDENWPPELVSAWFKDGTVYVSVRLNEEQDPNSISGELMLDKSAGSERTSPAPAPSERIILLVDLSTSMPGYSGWLRSFADGLLSTGTENLTVTLAGFGEKYEPIADGITDAGELIEAVEGLAFSHHASDICGGTVDAIDAMADVERGDGELVHLVVLTDGIPYLTGDSRLEEDAIKSSAASARELIAEASEVIVHTVCFGQWESTTFDAFSPGTGLDLTVSGSSGAESAGADIARFTQELYEFSFPASWSFDTERVDSQVFLSLEESDALTFMDVPNLRDVSMPLELDSSDRPVLITPEPGGEGDPAGETPGEETPDGDISGSSSQQGEYPAEPNPGSSSELPVSDGSNDTDASGFSSEIAPAGSSSVPSGEEQDTGGVPVAVLIAVAAVILVLTAAVAVLLVRKSRKQGQPGTINVKFEVLEGRSRSSGKTYQMRDQLIIGSSRSCDIVIDDKAAAAKNARVYFDGQMMYIEDISGTGNVSVSGMRIFAPNRLRSGDEIWIGSVCFRLLF